MRRICFITLIILVHSLTAKPNDGFRFRYNELTGAARDATINCITSDSRGFIWFYNSTGLHRYDGTRLLTFDLVSQPALKNLAMTFLYLDRQDRLWIGTQSGCSRFDLKSWTITHLKAPVSQQASASGQYITTISEGVKGTIYMGTNNGKIFRASADSMVLVATLNTTSSNILSQVSVQAVHETGPGEIWALYEGKLVAIKESNGKAATEYNPISNFPQELISPDIRFLPNDRVLLVSENKGLIEFDLKKRVITRIQSPVKSAQFINARAFLLPLSLTRTGVLLNGSAFFVHDATTGKCTDIVPDITEQFRHLTITSMVTRGAVSFLTTEKGYIELQQQVSPFRNILSLPTASSGNQSIRSIYRHTDGQLFAGSYREGFIRIDESSGVHQKISNDFVYSFLPVGSGRVLLATEGQALKLFNPANGVIQPIFPDTVLIPRKDQMRKKYLISLARESDSVVWVGTYHGAFRFNILNGASTFVDGQGQAAQLQASKVYDILIRENKILFATSGGLFELDRSKGSITKWLESGPDQLNISFFTIRYFNGRYYAGTNGRGICVMDEQGRLLQEINGNNGLAGNSVYFLQPEKRYLIAGTDRGLSHFDPVSGRMVSFTRQDNLPSNEFNHSATFAGNGKFYFGTINGITIIDTGALAAAPKMTSVPRLQLASFITIDRNGIHEHFNIGYLSDPSIEMEAGTHYFSLRFGGSDEELDQLHYFYRLSDQDSWLETGRDHTLSFTNISPGKYRLELAFKKPGDKTLTIIPGIPLIIHAAFYQTWWFFAICLLAIAGLVYWLVQYRMRQLLKEQQLRTRIAGDLHDEVGSSLTRIYFQADLLMMQKGQEESLQKIASASKDALGVMSDMVWSIDARFDTLEELVLRIKDYLNKLQEELEISCPFSLQGDVESKPVSQVVRQNFFRIFKEAMNNAIRYGNTPLVQVEMVIDKELRLSITNEIIAGQQKMKYYQGKQGNHYMQERAAKMNATLTRRQEGNKYILQLIIPYSVL